MGLHLTPLRVANEPPRYSAKAKRAHAHVNAMKDKAFRVLDNTIYTSVGYCIYCGATTRLEREHILPFALSGTSTLPQSTCRDCATITGSFEQAVLRGPFWPVRVYRDLKSRTKHRDAPTTLPLTVVRNGEEQIIVLKIKDYPTLIHFPLFAPPAHLTRSTDYKCGITISGIASILFGPRPDDVAKSLGATELKVTANYQPVAFARMIAKIAYAFAAAERTTDDLDGEPFVLPALLGQANDIGRWVGTLTKPFETHSGQLHRIIVHYDKEKGLLIAEVQLFADSQTPSYGVILGKLKP